MRFILPLILLSFLPACGGNAADEARLNETFEQNMGAEPEADPTGSAAPAVDQVTGTVAVPVPARFDWTGTFAATPALCEGGRWRFSRDDVVTDGETSCQIGEVEEGPDRAVLELACVAEGNETSETWTLTRTGEDSFRVERDTGAETVTVDLSRCANP